MDNDQEQEWLTGLRSNDAETYRRVVNSLIGPLLRTARRYLPEQDACDAVQEAFIKMNLSINTFRGASSLHTWVQRILINICLSQLRKKPEKSEISIDEFLPDYLDDGHVENPSAPWSEHAVDSFKTADNREKICGLVDEYLQKLPVIYRTVIMLRDIEGLSGQETADQLDISLSAMKVRLHRARQALKKQLDPVMQEGEYVNL